ncbi:MAG TPA: putative Ig domain-containing protein, partial [Tahibacter sp.]|nr:putative Ig domain-containing protein [Tahibacter sp.]
RGLMDPAIAWRWSGSVDAPTFKQVVSIPLVAQTNDDNGDGVVDARDQVDVIVSSGHFESTVQGVSLAILRVLDGRTGEEIAHSSVNEAIDNYATPAVGDIDGDGLVEIVVLTWDWKLAVFSHDLQLEWKTASGIDAGRYGRGAIQLADLDGDGTVEILTSGKVFDATGQLKFALSGGVGRNFDGYGGIVSVADLDGDGKQEIIGGGTVYRHDGSVLWVSSAFVDGYTAVGDLVGDSAPEIVLVRMGQLTLLDRHGVTLWGPITLPYPWYGGPPTLADMDGDGRPEIGIATHRNFLVYKADGALLWEREVTDYSSGVTGSSVFDFDGDGRAEVLALDHERWRIYRGNDGHVLFESGNSTGTQYEYPVVADVDGEPGAEVLIVANDWLQQQNYDTDTAGQYGVTVWRSATGSWMPTRALWNQYAYHIDNVADDATIPAQPVKSWLTHNTYRLNAFPDGKLPPLPDLAPFDVTLTRDANGAHLTARVRNRGLAASAPNVVRFYAGDPQSGGTLLGEAALPALAANSSHNAIVDIAANAALGDLVYATVDGDTIERECDDANNAAAAAIVRVRASDLDDASDTQTYTLSVAPVNHAPTIPTQMLPTVELDRAYATRLVASDPDRGDALHYTLLEGPDKLVLDEVSGAIRWTALPTQLGTHPLRVRIADLAGLGQDLSLTLTVALGPNRAPIVSSEPIVTVYANSQYSYQVYAYDPDSGDRTIDFTYAMVGPGNASIGGTGLVWWYPTLAYLGDHTVRVRVTDVHGATGEQQYTLRVIERPNRAPVIVTGAQTSATVGSAYTYDVNATDPDGDTLTYSLSQSPAGMMINAASGIIEWTPAVNQVGPNPVTVRVADGRGGEVEQAFTINVVLPPNRAPVFTSTPVIAAEVAADYAYSVTASDPDSADTLSYTLVSGPAGLTLDANHVVRWRPLLAQVGTHTVSLKVTDNGSPSLSATQSFDIVVSVPANNAPPSVTSEPANTATIGTVYAYDVIATDPDGDALSYTLSQLPNGMTVNATGELRWTPIAAQAGTHEIALVVADGRGGTATQSWPISVSSAGGGNRPPTITSAPGTNASVGTLYQYDVDATDADGDTLVYSLVQAPGGMTIDTTTGLVAWTPSAAGTVAVAVRVDDGNGAGIVQTYTLNVRAAGANRLPTITSAPPASARVGRVFAYDIAASDADGDALTYTLQQSPSGMTIDAAGLVRWTPTATGSVPVTVRVADAQGYAEQIWTITVVAANAPLDVTLTVTPTSVNGGDPIVVRVVTEGSGGGLTATATLDGTPVTVNPNGDTTLTAPTTPGVHTIAVTVSDGVASTPASVDFGVADPNDTAAPVVVIGSPADGSEITQPVDVRGTVSDASLQSWVLAVRAANTPDAPTTILARGKTNVADAIVGRLDPTLLMNDQYVVILQATDTGGRTTSASVVVRVTGEMKVGHYAITLEDINLPVAGIPIQVTRTYDTRRRAESLDFGHGWSVDYQNVRVRESQRLGYSWRLEMRGGLLNRQACVIPNGPRTVTVTLPDGDVETFEAVATPECHSLNTEVMVSVGFRGVDNTHSTLEQLDYSNLRLTTLAGNPVSVLSDPGTPDQPADPSRYRLTTREGVAYELDQHFGVRRVTDSAGNTLTYSASGIVHSTGQAIAFERDADNRIRRIVLPDQSSIRYDYDANGDLVASTDAANQTTRYTYKPRVAHYLEDLIDARNIRVQRNEYDADGRLVKSIDADGKAIAFDHAIDERTERVKNRRGFETMYTYDDQGYVLTETNALNQTTHHTYDPDGNELTRKDPLNRTTAWTYDIYGNRLAETNHLGETTRSEYGARNALVKQYSAQYPTRVTMANVYDARWGELQTTTDAMGQVTAFTYDRGPESWETGELRSIRDPAMATTQFAVNPFGWQTGSIDAHGHITNVLHDKKGQVIAQTTSRTDGQGNTVQLATSYVLDEKGRVTSTTHPDASVTTTTYTPIDKPSSECDTQSRCTTTEYDSRGNDWKTTYPDATFEMKEYDENGNVIAQTDRAGRTTRMVFDALDRMTKTIHPDDTPNNATDNPFSETVYDAAGRVEATIDENGNLTTYGYDDADRRTSVTNAKNETTTTAYDADGRRTSVTDAQNRTAKFVYDDAGKLVETIHPDEGVDDGNDANNPRTITTYDAAGRKIADTDDNGRITRFAYDKLGRLIAVFLPNPATGANPPYSGDPPVSSDSGVLVTRYRYDELGNKREQEDATGNVTKWTYDNNGRMLTRKLPLLQNESFVYDALGRRTQHTDVRGRITAYTYKP